MATAGVCVAIAINGGLRKVRCGGGGFFVATETDTFAVERIALVIAALSDSRSSFEEQFVEKVTEGYAAFFLVVFVIMREYRHCFYSWPARFSK